MQDDGKVILRYRDGHTERATVAVIDAADEVLNCEHDGAQATVPFSALKAVFFPRTVPEEQLEEPSGSVIAVEFADGEVIRGVASGYHPEASGFFLFPHDRSKNERIFVVRDAIASIEVEKL
jgi:hypothetical protein